MKKIHLSTSEALVLQQVCEDVEDNAWTLARQSGMTRKSIMSIISRLQRKGLVSLTNDLEGLWVSLTKKGRALVKYIWPELALQRIR